MSEELVNQGGSEDPETGLATREILDRWLAHDSMSLRHATLIANGANPEREGRGVSAARKAAVRDAEDVLTRSVELTPVGTVGGQELYETALVFQVLAAKNHDFPAMVQEALLEKNLIPSGTRRVRSQPHGNTVLNEDKRVQVMHAMIQVLADTALHPTCRKGAAMDGRVVGIELARTIVRNQKTLFDGGKSPQKPESIAKLFNQIVPPQVR